MSRSLEFRPEAQREIEDAFAWYEGQRSGLGLEFLLELEAALEEMKRHSTGSRTGRLAHAKGSAPSLSFSRSLCARGGENSGDRRVRRPQRPAALVGSRSGSSRLAMPSRGASDSEQHA